MPSLFRCQTNDAYRFKILAELLSNNIKTGSFQITKKGITLRMFDTPRRIMVDLNLPADNFSSYKMNSDSEELHIGINLKHFYKILRSAKKKDSLEMFINKDVPTDLNIRTYPKENNRVTTSTLKIQDLQHITTDVPVGYGNAIVVNSSDFQKCVKN